MRLDGKTAFVTGADSGIGRAIAITFAREGADVGVLMHNDKRGAEQTAHAIQHHGRRAEMFEADFSTPGGAEGLIAEVLARMRRIDVLVNDAGTGAGSETSLETSTDEFLRVLNVDLVAPFILAREAGKHMAERGTGSIINITSVHEEIPQAGGAAYCASKGGLKMVTKCLALELAAKGVRVNNIAPGMITSPMTTPELIDAEKAKEAMGKIPMHRQGEAQEIANVALFLASDEASYVTGSSYFADGGLRQRVGLAEAQ